MPPANAQQRTSWYTGIGTGSSHIEVYRGSLIGFGSWEAGSNDGAWLFFGGFRPSRHFAVDLAYIAERQLEWREQSVFVDGLPGIYDSRTTLDTSALQLSVLGMLPYRDLGELYLRGGISWYDAGVTQNLTDLLDGQELARSTAIDDTSFLVGIGIAATISEHWRARLEYQISWLDHALINVGEENDPTIDTWFLGFEYRFGPRAR